MYSCHIWRAWYNGPYAIMAKPIRARELHYPMIQFLIINISGRTLNCDHYSKETFLANGGCRPWDKGGPRPKIRGHGLEKNVFFSPSGLSLVKKWGPLDPPLPAILIVYIRIYDSVWKTSVFVIQFVVETYPASGASFWLLQWGGEIRDRSLFIE